MKLYTKAGVCYADYQDGSAPVRCDSSYQMWGQAFATRNIRKSLGHKVSTVTNGVDSIHGTPKKTVKIVIGDPVKA